MPIVPLYGHAELRTIVQGSIARGSLPSSLLLYGPAGVGKQRLALWIAQLLLCEKGAGPCESCRPCRYVRDVTHPDLHWFFPRPRLKDSNASPAEIREDLRDAIAERVSRGGLYPAPAGTEGIFVASIRAIGQTASMAPAMGKRKVFIVGDAERMVPREGSEDAAGAFLKILEEPPADTTIILTSSEVGALIPTIRSRVSGIRVPPVADVEVRAFLADSQVSSALKQEDVPPSVDERVVLAAGAPGKLFGGSAQAEAYGQARKLLAAASGTRRAERIRLAMAQGTSKARGGYADSLDALSRLLHDRLRSAVQRGDESSALRITHAITEVERTKEQTTGNANPQLLTAVMLMNIAPDLQ